MKRKRIKKVISHNLLENLNTPMPESDFFDVLKIRIEIAKKDHPNCNNFEIDIEHDYEVFNLQLIGIRNETDIEYNKRLEKRMNVKDRKAKQIKDKIEKLQSELKELK